MKKERLGKTMPNHNRIPTNNGLASLEKSIAKYHRRSLLRTILVVALPLVFGLILTLYLYPDKQQIADIKIKEEAQQALADGDLETAILLYKKVLDAKEKEYGQASPIVLEILNKLASTYQLKGDYEEAERLYRRAIITAEKGLGLEHPNTATTLNNLASVFKKFFYVV